MRDLQFYTARFYISAGVPNNILQQGRPRNATLIFLLAYFRIVSSFSEDHVSST